MQEDDSQADLYDYEDDDAEEPIEKATSPSDRKLEREYEEGRLRVVQERNDFFLPHVVDFITDRQWSNLSPEYQRRLRWGDDKKSRLIESLLMNVPVPAVFLYDAGGTRLEVLDGQQRITTIVDFLNDKLELTRLKIWPALNGRNFSQLPPALRRGLKRAKLSAITLIAQPAKTGSEVDLRAQVFDRLNTGGEKLNPQELRNCLYSGSFNKLIIELAGRPDFTKAWEIPSRAEHTLSDGSYDEVLRVNKLFSTMADCQIVLRFFAFRDEKYVVGSTRSILDKCMQRLRNPDERALESMRDAFVNALDTAISLFGESAFRIAGSRTSRGRLSRPLFDAEMIALDRLADQKAKLLAKKNQVVTAVSHLTKEGTASYETIVGRPNTSAAIKSRIDVVEKAMRSAIA